MLETVTMLISFRLYLHFTRDGKIVVVSYHSLHLQQLNPVFTLILFSARRTTWMLKTRKLLDGFKLSRQHFSYKLLASLNSKLRCFSSPIYRSSFPD